MDKEIPYSPPEFEKTAFNCPYCNAYANQLWGSMQTLYPGRSNVMPNCRTARCTHCEKYSLWYNGNLIYPEDSGVPLPNPDLQDDIKEDYLEAKNIVNKSPRGAAALLRLCIQKLCKQLGEKGENINEDIASLVQKGLPEKIQKALDIVRVIGNEGAVHPGQIDMKDDRETAMRLFGLVNLIAENMISQPCEIDKMYASLPPTKLDAIKNRDKS